MHQQHPTTIGYFTALEERKRRILERLDEMGSDWIHWQPAADGWSAVQIINHLNDAELNSLRYCMKKLKAGDALPPVSFTSQLKFQMYRLLLHSRIRFSAPKIIQNPSNKESLEEVKQEWGETRAQLGMFIKEYPEKYSKRGIYRHPFGGRMRLDQMILFFDAHVRHHEFQLERLFKKMKDAKASQ